MKSETRIRTWLSLLCVSVLIAGCGFHLRGNVNLPPELHQLAITTEEPYSYFVLQLKRALRASGIALSEDRLKAPVTLRLFDEITEISVLSESASTATKKYLLHYQVSYQLLTNNLDEIYGPQTVSSNRSLLVNEDQVLSSGNEQE